MWLAQHWSKVLELPERRLQLKSQLRMRRTGGQLLRLRLSAGGAVAPQGNRPDKARAGTLVCWNHSLGAAEETMFDTRQRLIGRTVNQFDDFDPRLAAALGIRG